MSSIQQSGQSAFVDDGFGPRRDAQGRPVDEFYYAVDRLPRRRASGLKAQSTTTPGLPAVISTGKSGAIHVRDGKGGPAGDSSGAPARAGSLQNLFLKVKELFHVIQKTS